MSNILNLLSEECFGEKMDTLNRLLAAIASNTGGLTIKSFSDLQNLTRLGLASKVVSIGDQISCEKATSITAAVSGTGITAATVDFEKFRKATKTTAGAYAFTYDGAWKLDGKAVDIAAYGITVTGTPANGDVVTVTEQTETLVWDIIGIDHDTPVNKNYKHSVTLQLHGCLSTLLQFDAAEPTNPDTNRQASGSSNWAESGIRQWLNSAGGAGTWWQAQTEYDVQPRYADTLPGFLKGLDDDFLAATDKVSKLTANNTADGGGSYSTTERFFLLSKTEVNGGASGNVQEGKAYSFYSDNSGLTAPGTGGDANRIKYINGTAQKWTIRSTVPSNSYVVYTATETGSLGGSWASVDRGISPACCIV